MGRYQYPFESHFVNVEGVRLHYVEQGAGDPVLMVHGQPTWSYLYRHIIPPVAARHRAIALDLMGFGLSDKPPGRDYSFAQHAAIVKGFIEALGLRRLTLVLHDWGGPIGLHYAVQHRDNINRLVLMNTAATLDFKLPLAFRLAFRVPVVSDLLVGRLNVFGRWAVKYAARHPSQMKKEVLRNYLEPHPTYASRKGVISFPRLIPITPRDEAYAPMKAIAEAMPAFDVPTLYIAGDHDPVSRRANPGLLVSRMPNARLKVIPDAGHFLQEDRPEAVARAIVEFLDEAEGAPAAPRAVAGPDKSEAAP